MDTVLCNDEDSWIAYALSRALFEAKETSKLIYLYSDDSKQLHMTDKYPERKIEARVYPGGRRVLYRKWQNTYYPTSF